MFSLAVVDGLLSSLEHSRSPSNGSGTPLVNVIIAMIGTGLLLAVVLGLRLTLAGTVIASIFVLTIVIQTNLVAEYKASNKRALERVAEEHSSTGQDP